MTIGDKMSQAIDEKKVYESLDAIFSTTPYKEEFYAIIRELWVCHGDNVYRRWLRDRRDMVRK
jgi:hypothetical protein